MFSIIVFHFVKANDVSVCQTVLMCCTTSLTLMVHLHLTILHNIQTQTIYSCVVDTTGHWKVSRCDDRHHVVCQSDYYIPTASPGTKVDNIARYYDNLLGC